MPELNTGQQPPDGIDLGSVIEIYLSCPRQWQHGADDPLLLKLQLMDIMHTEYDTSDVTKPQSVGRCSIEIKSF